MNRVSIVVPVYNSSRFLDECIYSIRTQTYKNIEIIVIDDGSTDESVEIIRKHALEDERIKCYSQKNRGVAVARNKGIQLSTSELLMFVDSDDTLFPNSVEILAQHSDCDFIMGGYEILNMENGEIQVNSCSKFWGKADKFFMNISMYLTPPFLLSPCFKLFKKSIIKSYNILFPERMNYGEDAEFVLSYCEHIKTVCCENRSCYSYRKYGTDSLSSKFRVDKLAINNRINDHIISDILLYGNNNINEIECRYVQNYVEYAKELFTVDMKYKEKRRIFFKVGLQENMLERAKQFGRLSVAQKLIIGSLRTRLFFPVYLIFLLKGKNEKVKV